MQNKGSCELEKSSSQLFFHAFPFWLRYAIHTKRAIPRFVKHAYCTEGAETTNFDYAKQLYAAHGYRLPKVVFWNVASRRRQQPVIENEQGVALVSGCTPRIFGLLQSGASTPYAYMLEVLGSERYQAIVA